MRVSPIKVLFTQAQRQAIADGLPGLTARLKLGEKNQRTHFFTTEELEEIQQMSREALPHADTGLKRNSHRHIIAVVAKSIEDSQGILAIPPAERLYQFKITLLGSEPPIWRRIQVANCTLDKLHEHIQTCMGWTNSHLHRFEIGNKRYADPMLMEEDMDEFGYQDSTRTKISQVVPKSGERLGFSYEYDFGDGWKHEVLFEGCPRKAAGTKYPVCLEGDRACPPKDCGGIGGFYEFLEALADPRHEQHDDFLEWSGGFDPEKFDAKQATQAMKQGLPDWREEI